MILLQPWCLWYICLHLTFNENTWYYLFLVLFCVASVQCNHKLRMDVYTCPELTDMIMCLSEMEEELSAFPNRNHPHHTMFARLYQRLWEDASLHAYALVEDRVKQGHLLLMKKCLRVLATTPQLAHVPLPMPWVQMSLQCCES